MADENTDSQVWVLTEYYYLYSDRTVPSTIVVGVYSSMEDAKSAAQAEAPFPLNWSGDNSSTEANTLNQFGNDTLTLEYEVGLFIVGESYQSRNERLKEWSKAYLDRLNRPS